IASGQWTVESYAWNTSDYSGATTISTPSAILTYNYGPIGVQNANDLIDGGIGLLSLTVDDVHGNGSCMPFQSETRTYESHGVFYQLSDVVQWFFSALPKRRVITRCGAAYATEYGYASDYYYFANYHRPVSIVETGTGNQTRNTSLNYSRLLN